MRQYDFPVDVSPTMFTNGLYFAALDQTPPSWQTQPGLNLWRICQSSCGLPLEHHIVMPHKLIEVHFKISSLVVINWIVNTASATLRL